MTNLEIASKDIGRRFTADYFKHLNPEKIGNLMFEFHDTHGLQPDTQLEVLEEAINQDIRREWKKAIMQGVEIAKSLEG